MPVSRRRNRKQRNAATHTTKSQTRSLEAEKWEWQSYIAQPLVIIVGVARFYIYGQNPAPAIVQVLLYGALTFMIFAMLYLHIPTRFGRRRRLLTKGFFKYTRHPIYTGLVLADARVYWGTTITWQFIFSTLVFYGGIILVSHIHEQEVLAKFGQQAKDYYARTPRIFLLYPFMKKK